MGCGSCGTSSGLPGGCKSNGTCGTSGCNKLNVYNWLSDTAMPDQYVPFNIIEIRFKGSKKEFFKNVNNFDLYNGDAVIVDSDMGYDLGHVSLAGELVKLQLKKRGIKEDSDQIKTIQRKASEKDIEKYQEAKFREAKVLERARTISIELKLDMKLSDIEIQGDNKKVVFFYTAESRVDIRELIKRFADEFRLRIEMRQIGYREEASRLGGIGSCGRELCCSTWLTDFKMVNTSAARFQNLSINMLKLSGQCGKLKCCLNYELDTYMDALSEFPKAKTVKIDTVMGPAIMIKTDILKRLTWFTYEDKFSWICIPLEKVNAYLQLNAKGQKAPELIGEVVEVKSSKDDNEFADRTVELVSDEITRMDNKARPKATFNKKPFVKGNNNSPQGNNNNPQQGRNNNSQQGNNNNPQQRNNNNPQQRNNNNPPQGNNNNPPQGNNNNPPQGDKKP